VNLEDLYFNLPHELIAQHPIYPRDYSKLMVLNRNTQEISHKKFYEILEFFKKGDILVLNDSKVIKARFYGSNEKTGGKREIFLLKQIDKFKWKAFASPNKRVHEGDNILISKKPLIKVKIEKKEVNEDTLIFETNNLSMEEVLKNFGEVPLPPYIKGKIEDESEYQTIYASIPGSVASPTAGLHFTEKLIKELENKGIIIEYVTLHVGPGTFKPIQEKSIEKHLMHEEEFFISEETAKNINNAKAKGGKLYACGTTVVRSLETASTKEGILKPMNGKTKLFIKPGYNFKIVDAIITNFHFPRTTLLALVISFSGKELVLSAYSNAIKEKYRFFSFGDAMLII
jgi:S-adenosylmethionine:tRNA ribosyltransferase-isomerase